MLAPAVAQRQAEEEEPLQAKAEAAPNRTGMPDSLKRGVEALSGIDMSDVRVRTNSSKPAQLNAHAYAQGEEIHVAPGQEQHLPHEAWHIVQQRQGRVQPTGAVAGQPVNDDAGLEREADQMGAAAQRAARSSAPPLQARAASGAPVIQAVYEIGIPRPRRWSTSTVRNGRWRRWAA